MHGRALNILQGPNDGRSTDDGPWKPNGQRPPRAMIIAAFRRAVEPSQPHCAYEFPTDDDTAAKRGAYGKWCALPPSKGYDGYCHPHGKMIARDA